MELRPRRSATRKEDGATHTTGMGSTKCKTSKDACQPMGGTKQPKKRGRPATLQDNATQAQAKGTNAKPAPYGRKTAPQKASAAAAVAVVEDEVVERTAKKAKAGQQAGANRDMERALHAQGLKGVGGVDEAGRGPLAGPVVAACVMLPAEMEDIPGINDSKQLSENQREKLYEIIVNTPGVLWGVHIVDHTTIDRVNILQATMLAMQGAVQQLPTGSLDHILIDGNRIPKNLPAPAQFVIHGDALVTCIAAASIIAKVTRDRIMMALHADFPLYNFGQHKGYGVAAHCEAIIKHGPCPIHRKSFNPIRTLTGWTREAQLLHEASL